MLANMLAEVINTTFLKVTGRDQGHKENPQAFLVRFSIPVNYDIENGYRHISLVLYAKWNYVKVVTREEWDVISIDDLVYDDNGNAYVKKGNDYHKGQSDWKLLCNHDSCWRDAVKQFLFDNQDKLNCFGYVNGPHEWFKVIDLKSEATIYDLKDVLKFER